MAKLSREEYFSLFFKDDVTDEKILQYSRIVKGEGGFEWTLEPDPNKVEITEAELAEESAFRIFNSIERSRRARRFRRRLNRGEKLPILVSEGDSWFQFPFLIKEVIDQLEKDYLIWSVGAAGDTALNMVLGDQKRGQAEYLLALRSQQENVKGFVFSAAGNDILGEDPSTGESALFSIIKDYQTGQDNNPHAHINFSVLGEKLSFLKSAYQTVIGNIRVEPGFESLPIFVHGYDYVFPYPWGDDDPRNPIYAAKDQWLGKAFARRRYPTSPLRRDIMKILIDSLYDMLASVAGDSAQTQVWLVNCRGAMPNVTDWNDEIHGTSDGFKKVSTRFQAVISSVI